MQRPPASFASVARFLALPVVVAISAVLAVLLHRSGHAQGDDFALYLRQARSVFDGDIAQVVADNRFAVLNSDSSFSPIAYPWVWPLLLSPFVHAWGFDYERLKLIEVAAFCLWLALLHGIVRRRVGQWPALAVVAVFATAPAYLSHTDQLLTEFPHMAAIALVVWHYDRIRRNATLLTASTQQLVVLGALIAIAFNVRRESIVFVAVLGIMAVADIIDASSGGRLARTSVATVRSNWRRLLVPFVAFATSAALAQLLLPSDLLPDNGNSSTYLDDRLSEFPGILSKQLGLGEHTGLGVAIIALALVGLAIGLRRRPALDGPLALLAVLSALLLSTHLRRVDRYWFQVTPWVLYFAAAGLLGMAGWALQHRPQRIWLTLALAPLCVLVGAHMVALRSDIADARQFDQAGRVQAGPSNPTNAAIFDAVETLTPPDAIIAYYRARTMTLLTDRRSIQTNDLARLTQRADYYAERRNSTYWQPDLSNSAARSAGFVEVWSNQTWILWRLPNDGAP